MSSNFNTVVSLLLQEFYNSKTGFQIYPTPPNANGVIMWANLLTRQPSICIVGGLWWWTRISLTQDTRVICLIVLTCLWRCFHYRHPSGPCWWRLNWNIRCNDNTCNHVIIGSSWPVSDFPVLTLLFCCQWQVNNWYVIPTKSTN